ncbi:MAG: prepilin-type N-terminal cleavage/methylation domain-containing protein [Akkermansia sp.]|nr:prepilin-type N-terminal cleavage/methylation domain-containing protein [Akkermansia sp.]
MKTASSFRSRRGFTLIEIMVVIAILAALMAIATPAIYSHMSAGTDAKCRANLEQLAQLGTKYSQDMANRGTLPTSGMDDDEDTETIDESEGWWLSLAPELDAVVLPKKAGDKMKVSTIFHCPADHRTEIDASASTFPADCKSVSYVSWTDGSEDRENPNSPIKTTAKQNLDMLPWLSDGNPVKGESVTDLASFTKQVLPAAERHNGKIFVVMASGVVKVVEIDEDADAKTVFRKMAPAIAKKAEKEAKSGKGGKKGKSSRKAAEEDDEDEASAADDTSDDDED